MFYFERKNYSCIFYIVFVFWAKHFHLHILSQSYSKIGLHAQIFLFVLLNANCKWKIQYHSADILLVELVMKVN